jgi:serine/threonine protein kinase
VSLPDRDDKAPRRLSEIWHAAKWGGADRQENPETDGGAEPAGPSDEDRGMGQAFEVAGSGRPPPLVTTMSHGDRGEGRDSRTRPEEDDGIPPFPPPGHTSRTEEEEEFLAQFEHFEYIGRGKFGVVFRAQELAVGRPVVVKWLVRPQRDSLDDAQERAAAVEREARALGRLEGEITVVDVRWYGPGFGGMLLVTKFLEGPTLRQWAETQQARSNVERVRVARELLNTLCEIHSDDVLHLDIKPDNVIIQRTRGGLPTLVDFGLALADFSRLGQDDDVEPPLLGGTWGYIDPARYEGAWPTPASDLYAWGAVCYWLLTGEEPSKVGGPNETPLRIPEQSDELLECLRQHATAALVPDPRERSFDPWAAVADLDRRLALAALPALAPPRPSRRWSWILVGLMGASLFATTALLTILSLAPDPSDVTTVTAFPGGFAPDEALLDGEEAHRREAWRIDLGEPWGTHFVSTTHASTYHHGEPGVDGIHTTAPAGNVYVWSEDRERLAKLAVNVSNPYPGHDAHLGLDLDKVSIWGDTVTLLFRGDVHAWFPNAIVTMTWDEDFPFGDYVKREFWHPGQISQLDVLPRGPGGGPAVVAVGMNNAAGGRGFAMALSVNGASGQAPPFLGTRHADAEGLYWYRLFDQEYDKATEVEIARRRISVKFESSSTIRLDRYGNDAGFGVNLFAKRRWEQHARDLYSFQTDIERLQQGPSDPDAYLSDLAALVKNPTWQEFAEVIAILHSDTLARRGSRDDAIAAVRSYVGPSGDSPRAQTQYMRLAFDPGDPDEALAYWEAMADESANQWPRVVYATYLLRGGREEEARTIHSRLSTESDQREVLGLDIAWWDGDFEELTRLGELRRSKKGNTSTWLLPIVQGEVYAGKTRPLHSTIVQAASDELAGAVSADQRARRLDYRLAGLAGSLLMSQHHPACTHESELVTESAAELTDAYPVFRDREALAVVLGARCAASTMEFASHCAALADIVGNPAGIPPWLVRLSGELLMKAECESLR